MAFFRRETENMDQQTSNSIGHAEYFRYLRSRSWLGLFYRRFLLYPKLATYFSGLVFDVGCGIGDFLKYRPQTIGVDVNPHAVDWCRKRGLDARLMTEDRLPFGNDAFDGVMLDNVLEHLTQPGALLAEIRRVLSPGGRLLVGVPGVLGYACDPDHKIFYDEASLERLMASCGFLCRAEFHTLLKSRWLANRLSQYSLYGVYERP